MKNAVRLFAVLAILACAGFTAKPAKAVINDFCDNTRCNLFCVESGFSSGRCVWGACHCF